MTDGANRRWIKALAITTLSPRAMFKKKASDAVATTTKPVIELQTLELLAEMVHYLDQQHCPDDRLWHKDGIPSEINDLCTSIRRSTSNATSTRPDWALFRAHSITTAIKRILKEDYEPLVPYRISQMLLDGVDTKQSEETNVALIMQTFKHIRAITREFLEVLLVHLHRVSSRAATSHMDIKALAASIGIILIRPSDDKNELSSKENIKKRQQVAAWMIQHASKLPYDCPTELLLDTIPDQTQTTSVNDTSTNAPAPSLGPDFLQVSWDPDEILLTTTEIKVLDTTRGSCDVW